MISDDDFKKLTEYEKEKRRGRYRRKEEIWIIPEEEVDKPIEIDTIQKVEENKLKKIKMLKKVIELLSNNYKEKMFIKDSVYKLYPDLPRLRAIPYNEKRDRG